MWVLCTVVVSALRFWGMLVLVTYGAFTVPGVWRGCAGMPLPLHVLNLLPSQATPRRVEQWVRSRYVQSGVDTLQFPYTSRTRHLRQQCRNLCPESFHACYNVVDVLHKRAVLWISALR
jgi:hypothetical protein